MCFIIEINVVVFLVWNSWKMYFTTNYFRFPNIIRCVRLCVRIKQALGFNLFVWFAKNKQVYDNTKRGEKIKIDISVFQTLFQITSHHIFVKIEICKLCNKRKHIIQNNRKYCKYFGSCHDLVNISESSPIT